MENKVQRKTSCEESQEPLAENIKKMLLVIVIVFCYQL